MISCIFSQFSAAHAQKRPELMLFNHYLFIC